MTHSREMFLFLILLMVAVLVLASEARIPAEEVSDDIMIFNEGYRRKLYRPVWFPHLVHAEDYGFECAECHHTYEGGENVWQEGDPIQRCAACHDPVRKKGSVPRLHIAYHFNCKDCHEEIESGPIACEDCHSKIQSKP